MYCSIWDIIDMERYLNFVDYFTYLGKVFSKKHYGKTKKYH